MHMAKRIALPWLLSLVLSRFRELRIRIDACPTLALSSHHRTIPHDPRVSETLQREIGVPCVHISSKSSATSFNSSDAERAGDADTEHTAHVPAYRYPASNHFFPLHVLYRHRHRHHSQLLLPHITPLSSSASLKYHRLPSLPTSVLGKNTEVRVVAVLSHNLECG
jgi:hypothetical protein